MQESNTDRAHALNLLLEQAKSLRLAGKDTEAIALGPKILKAYFFAEHGYSLPYDKPEKFTEKIYRRMLDIHKFGSEVFTCLSDKLAVREYVSRTVGERHLTPLIWSGQNAADIPWSKLPKKSVLKCNEGSGKILFLDTATDSGFITEVCRKWQSESYYWFRREYHYLDVERNLQIEEFLHDGHADGPLDYIFYCFDGIPRIIQIGSRSHSIHRFFDTAWNPIDLSYREHYQAPAIPRPKKWSEMLDIAARLSSGFDFVRVDLYCCHDEIRFGEMTFTPRAGKLPFEPPEWDVKLGAYWKYAGIPESSQFFG